VIAGSSTAAVRRLMENSKWQEAGNWFRKGAGVCIGFLGIYFIVNTLVIL
jgi:cytochrome c-type biogenesis protein